MAAASDALAGYGEAFLIISALLQTWALVQAVRLALRQRRTGWALLALVNALMLARLSSAGFAVVTGARLADALTESMALAISLLMAVGLTLLLAWLKSTAGSEDSSEGIRRSAREQLKQQATLLGLASLLACATFGYFACDATRDQVIDRLLKGSLDLAHMLGTMADADTATPVTVAKIEDLWRRARSEYPNNFLRVIGEDGTLLLDTRRPEQAGTFVGSMKIPAGENAPGNVLELLAARRGWAGRNWNLEGEPQYAAYAYNPSLRALVAVNLSARSVDVETRAEALPWTVGIALLFLIVLPLSFGLLFYAASSSEQAAFEALRRLLASEEKSRAILEAEPECVKLISPEGRLLEMNPAGLAMLECSTLDEAQECPMAEWVVEEYRPGFADLHRRVMLGESGTLNLK